MTWFMIVAFAVSSSIDNLGVGLSYGVQKVHIQMLQNLLIAVICFLFSMGGIYVGIWVFTIIPGILPVLLGATLLFLIGLRIILLTKSSSNTTAKVEEQSSNLKSILKNPEIVGENPMKKIGWIESIVLGIALSSNALTNGIGAGLLGLSPLAISITAAVGSFISVWFGMKIGHRVANIKIGSFTIGQFGTIISGAILVMIAAGVLLKIYV